jgi:hypothetical protein
MGAREEGTVWRSMKGEEGNWRIVIAGGRGERGRGRIWIRITVRVDMESM